MLVIFLFKQSDVEYYDAIKELKIVPIKPPVPLDDVNNALIELNA